MAIPQHSAAAIQAKRHNYGAPSVVVVVEATADRTVYESLCDEALAGVHYVVRTISELGGHGWNAKSGLLRLHEEFAQSGWLSGGADGQRHAWAFVVDTDADDILGTLRRCPHLIYTDYYTLENYLFKDGDLRKAISNVAKIPSAAVNARIPDVNEWRRQAAAKSRNWIVLCLLAKHPLRTANPQGGFYSVTEPECSDCGLIPNIYAERRAIVRAAFSLSEADFSALEAGIAHVVDAAIADASFDRVFNGKWYVALVDREMTSLGSTVQSAAELLRVSLTHSLAQGWGAALRTGLAGIRVLVA